MYQESGGRPGWAALLDEQIRRHARLFFRLAHGIVRDDADAEDCFQQAFLKALEHQDRIEDPATLKSWLAKTVVNESLDLTRRRRLENRTRGSVPEIGGRLGPEEAHRQAERHKAVVAALQRLPDVERFVVALRLMQGVSGREVMELLGTSEADVTRKLHRGMEILRGMLGDWKEGL